MRLTFVFVLGAGILVSSAASAQEFLPGAEESPPVVAPADQASGDDVYSPWRALSWSLAGTAVGWGAALAQPEINSPLFVPVALTGILVGPSFGDVYLGESTRALVHTGIRTGATAALVVGLMRSGTVLCVPEDPRCPDPLGESIAAVGLAVLAVDTIVDIASAPVVAHQKNEERNRPHAVLAPASSGLGLALVGQF